MSLPLRERGLKFYDAFEKDFTTKSLPLRERGLKFLTVYLIGAALTVAPLAGAWIEILPAAVSLPAQATSLPLRERGLKSPSSCARMV